MAGIGHRKKSGGWKTRFQTRTRSETFAVVLLGFSVDNTPRYRSCQMQRPTSWGFSCRMWLDLFQSTQDLIFIICRKFRRAMKFDDLFSQILHFDIPSPIGHHRSPSVKTLSRLITIEVQNSVNLRAALSAERKYLQK